MLSFNNWKRMISSWTELELQHLRSELTHSWEREKAGVYLTGGPEVWTFASHEQSGV